MSREVIHKTLIEIMNDKPDEIIVVCRVGGIYKNFSVHAGLNNLSFMCKIAERDLNSQIEKEQLKFLNLKTEESVPKQ